MDAIDLRDVTILNAPDVRDWPIVGAITRLELTPGDMRFTYSKQDGVNAWPDVTPPGFEGPIIATLWAVVKVNGLWYASGELLFWRGRELSGDPLPKLTTDWFYDATRWGPLHGAPIGAGDEIGFFFTAGVTSNMQQLGLRERTAVAKIRVPEDFVGTFTFDAPPSEGHAGGDEHHDDTPDWAQQLVDAIDELQAALLAFQTDVRALNAKLDAVLEHGVKVHL